MRWAVLVALTLVLAGCGGGRELRAEFASARGLVEGNDVRYDGAVVGRVDTIRLTRRGTAMVSLALRDAAPVPHADATATIRPADLLGDTYVAYTPGTTGALRGPLPTSRTVTVARLDDLLSTFDPDVRAALRALLVEGGIALDRRGTDLGRLTVSLRPALAAADGTLRSLAAERASLRSLISDAERTTGPVARRTRALATAVESFARVLDETGSRPAPLAAGLDGMPATLRTLRATTDRLGATAIAARPLAAQLSGVAPALGEVVDGAPALLERTRTAIRAANPALDALRRLLRDGRGTLVDAGRGLRTLATQAPDIARLAALIATAAPGISKGFFDNFADQAAETGRQPFDPFADPSRAYWRGAAVFSCESFGVPVAPGCLRRYLGLPAGARRERRRSRPARAAATPVAPVRPVVPGVPQVKVPRLPLPTVVPQVTQQVVKPIGDILDFLLKP